MSSSAAANGPWSSTAIDAASHGAIAFCQIYYEAYDEPSRRAKEVPLLFLPDSKIIWNGNVVEPANLAPFLEGMPFSRHDLQTVDCHPIAGSSSGAPDLIVNVTGSVLQGPSVMRFSDTPNLAPQDHPRKFHEVFMLRSFEQGEGMQPRYAIKSSNFRFIG